MVLRIASFLNRQIPRRFFVTLSSPSTLNCELRSSNVLTSRGCTAPAAWRSIHNAPAHPVVPPSRTVCIGNLPPDTSVNEFLDDVYYGPLEIICAVPEKRCVLLSFLDISTAAAFFNEATWGTLKLRRPLLDVTWEEPSIVPVQVMYAVRHWGATRAVHLGKLPAGLTEEMLRDELSAFGSVEQVRVVADKNIASVHFLSISAAITAVKTLRQDPAWIGKSIWYGRDRCVVQVPPNNEPPWRWSRRSRTADVRAFLDVAISPDGDEGRMSLMSPPSGTSLNMAGGNRTVYLGPIPPATTTKELCDWIRGGALESVRYFPDRHFAFVTFIDPAAAFTFIRVFSSRGLRVNVRLGLWAHPYGIPVNWARKSRPLPQTLALAVEAGATRNVCIGNVEDFEAFSEARLRADFGPFGDIERISLATKTNSASVNFTDISNAITAVDAIKGWPGYAKLDIGYGKDRCAGPLESSLATSTFWTAEAKRFTQSRG
ncbi:hypothetical protein DFH09DRAFT_908368 [Mycena vulgaris]|nr:hypothetical protein DFH09DRAFT_908368 [Mycena vulgaris]